MDALQRARRPVRRDFDKHHRELETLLKEEKLKADQIAVKFNLLSDTYDQLKQHDMKIVEQFSRERITEDEENKEFDEIGEFKTKFETIRVSKEQRLPSRLSFSGSVSGGGTSTEVVQNFKLYPAKLKKFSGELIDWLSFWAQFEKLHEDPSRSGSEKLWYFQDAMEPNTEAYELVSIYPQTNENYSQAVAALKKRYGNEDVLLQVYLRQLLNLVISNVGSREKIPVKMLYLKLDSHLRVLKSLQLDKVDPISFFHPMVESSLPEKMLDNWQRSPLSSHDGGKDDPPRSKLDLLMAFVENEVQILQKIDISRSFDQQRERFESRHERERRSEKRELMHSHRKLEKRANIPTLSSFHNAENKECVFCGRANHQSKDCFRAKNMTYEEKIAILKKKQLCFRCCGPHLGRDCNAANVECTICSRTHHTVLCKDYQRKREATEPRGPPPSKRVKHQTVSDKRESNFSNVEGESDVALQTLLVKIVNGEKQEIVRAFIDGGSQKSYISKKIAMKLRLEPFGTVRVGHALFGGHVKTPVTHNKYSIVVHSLQDQFKIEMQVREQDTISCGIPRITDGHPVIREELRARNVQLTDDQKGPSEIGLLIGGDWYAKLRTDEQSELNCGVLAINTKLGWTLLGSVDEPGERGEAVNLCLSMSVSDTSVTNLWELDVLGIHEPSTEKEIQKKKQIVRENFVKSIVRDQGGRYSIKLPWKENVPNLPSNREVAFKRLQSATQKLQQQGMFEAYNAIFCHWESEGFIERVPPESHSRNSHYLPHRPVIKLESLTTPVRPVFDASCRVGKSPSLNDCLLTGENYVLLIPEIMQRFREKRVGFVSDIRKAFQMIGVKEEDRDVMRFLWWSDNTMRDVIEFRHARVMFGATCSPFILAAVLFHHLSSLPEEEKVLGNKLLETFYVDNCVSSENTREDYHLFKKKATEIMSRARMDLRMWQSNIDEIDDDSTPVISVLGLQWDKYRDELYVNVKNISIPEKISKRVILSTVHKIFDPIGFVRVYFQ